MSRRRHPYFSQINRLEGAYAAAPGQGGGFSPPMAPDEQLGVLWQALRETSQPA